MAKTDGAGDAAMEKWNRRRKTNENYTQWVDQRGGYTEVNPQHQLANATADWGFYGQTWGLRNLIWGYLKNAAGEIVEITLEYEFWCPDGVFPMGNDMRWKAGDECRKKLLTNSRSKALSTMGFNSDVYEGEFDESDSPKKKAKPSGSGNLAQDFDRGMAERRGAGAGSATGDAPPTPTPKKPRKAIDPAEDQRHREEITQMLAEMYGDNADEIAAHIERACGFQGDRGWVSKSRVEDLKGAWLAKTRNKVREDYEKRG